MRNELVELVGMLVQECKNRGYRFGTSSDPSYGCWGYSCRQISGSNNPSNHSWGLAVDINAPSNPYTSPLQTDMPNWMPDLWNEYGFRWGGDYSGSKDAMHYEFMGSVNDAAHETNRARDAGIGGGSTPPPPEEDWFDMATEDDLRRIMQEEIAKVWTLPIGPGYPAGDVLNTVGDRVATLLDRSGVVGRDVWAEHVGGFPASQVVDTMAGRVATTADQVAVLYQGDA